jgi:hypothetical protein
MIAMTLGALVSIGIFHLLDAMVTLHRRQRVLSESQDNMRFMSQYMREKIQNAGDWSCLKKSKAPRSIVMRRYNANAALSELGLTIKPHTDLLQLQECVRFHDKKHYLPMQFFVANTFRVNRAHREIDALFYKIAHHPREELMTGVVGFHVRLYRVPHQKKNIRAVKIIYLLSSQNHSVNNPQTYWFDDKVITAKDYAFYQPGILYAVRRMCV